MFFSYWMSSYFGTLFLFWIGLVDSFILLVDWLSFYGTLLGINKHNYYLLSNLLFLAIVGSKKNISIVGSIVSISSNYCWMAKNRRSQRWVTPSLLWIPGIGSACWRTCSTIIPRTPMMGQRPREMSWKFRCFKQMMTIMKQQMMIMKQVINRW